MALEIDDFDSYRDQHGDLVADRILKQVGGKIKGALRDADIVSRIDKAVLAIALAPVRRVDLESVIQLSARLQHAVAEPILINGLRLYVTASVGFCLPRRASGKTGLASLDAAEMALVEAQSSGAGAIRAYCPQPRMKRVMHTIPGQLGCGHVQGYSIARPMPFADMLDWVQAHCSKLLERAQTSRQTS